MITWILKDIRNGSVENKSVLFQKKKKKIYIYIYIYIRFKQTSTKNSGPGSLLMKVLQKKVYREKYEIPLG